jgi:hypothetical protein
MWPLVRIDIDAPLGFAQSPLQEGESLLAIGRSRGFAFALAINEELDEPVRAVRPTEQGATVDSRHEIASCGGRMAGGVGQESRTYEG